MCMKQKYRLLFSSLAHIVKHMFLFRAIKVYAEAPLFVRISSFRSFFFSSFNWYFPACTKRCYFPLISDKIEHSARVQHVGEAERRTLLNLIQAIDKNQVLLSAERGFSYRTAKHELWKQVTHSFNDITGRNVSMMKLHGVVKRMKGNQFVTGTYLEYDKDLKKWIFH